MTALHEVQLLLEKALTCRAREYAHNQPLVQLQCLIKDVRGYVEQAKDIMDTVLNVTATTPSCEEGVEHVSVDASAAQSRS